MHYTIDGYNLLFYLFGPSLQGFKWQRDKIIHDLNVKIEFLGLDITVVFDSHLHAGEGTRSHYHHLEIVYTPEGITADDFIINQLNDLKDTTKEVVITNDRNLSMRARDLFATTQCIDHFLNWLNKRYNNQRRSKTKSITRNKTAIAQASPSKGADSSLSKPPEKKLGPPARSQPKLMPPPPPPPLPPPPPALPLLPAEAAKGPQIPPGSFEYYLSQFETAHQTLLQKELEAKIARKTRNKANRKKQR